MVTYKLDGRKMNKQEYNNIKLYIDKHLDQDKINNYINNELDDEIEYHQHVYNCNPKKIYFLHPFTLLMKIEPDYSNDIMILNI